MVVEISRTYWTKMDHKIWDSLGFNSCFLPQNDLSILRKTGPLFFFFCTIPFFLGVKKWHLLWISLIRMALQNSFKNKIFTTSTHYLILFNLIMYRSTSLRFLCLFLEKRIVSQFPKLKWTIKVSYLKAVVRRLWTNNMLSSNWTTHFHSLFQF